MMATGLARTNSSEHRIGKQTITVLSIEPDQVSQMQARIARLNSASLHSAIEEVFSEFDPGDRLITIDDITVNLGHIPQDGLEYTVEDRLRTALRQELARLISASPPSPSHRSSGSGDTERTHRSLELLLTATPAISAAPTAHPGGWFAMLERAFKTDPFGTIQMLRRAARRPGTVVQLTRLLKPFQLGSLVRSLDPANATTLILLAGKVTESYIASPLEKKPLGGFDQPVWNLVLNYLLREPGTEFNRRQYVTSLLEKIAADTGLLLRDVIDIVAGGLELLDRQRRVQTSLASVLRKVVVPQDEVQDRSTDRTAVAFPARSQAGPGAFARLSPRWLRAALQDVEQSLGHDMVRLLEPHFRLDRSHTSADRTEIGREFSSRQLQELARYLSQDPPESHAFAILQHVSGSLLEAMLASLGQSEQSALLKGALLAARAWGKDKGARIASEAQQKGHGSPAPAAQAKYSQSEGIAPDRHNSEERPILLDYLRTGLLSIASRQKLRISSAAALNRAIQETAARHRGDFAEAVRTGSQSPRATEVWLSALEPETLGLLADCALPNRGRHFLAGAQALARVARQARMSDDRIAELSAAFWKFQFSQLDRPRKAGATTDDLIAAFLDSLASWNRAKPGGRQGGLLAELANNRVPKSRPETTRFGSQDASMQPLLNALEQSGAAALKAIEALDPRTRRALLGTSLARNPRSRRAIGKLSERHYRELLALSVGAKARDLLAATRTLLDATRLLRSVASAERQRLAVRIFLSEHCENEFGRKLDLSRLLLEFSAKILPQLASSSGTNSLAGMKGRTALKARWLSDVRRLARIRKNPSLARSADRLYSKLHSQRQVGIRKHTSCSVQPELFEAKSRVGVPVDLRRASAFSSGLKQSSETAGYPVMSSGMGIIVANAGLVLAAPFLPHLFAQCDLLGQEGTKPREWRNRAAYARAVFLTQYLVAGSTVIERADLALNKVICGGGPDDVLDGGFKPSDQESELCDRLLEAMLANWPALSTGTSIDGLRDGFLERSGWLGRSDVGWSLVVERKTLDVLLDQVGWGFRTILLPWQVEPLQVTW